MKNPFKYGKFCGKWYPVVKLEFRIHGLADIKLTKIIKVGKRYVGLTIFKNDIVSSRLFILQIKKEALSNRLELFFWLNCNNLPSRLYHDKKARLYRIDRTQIYASNIRHNIRLRQYLQYEPRQSQN